MRELALLLVCLGLLASCTTLQEATPAPSPIPPTPTPDMRGVVIPYIVNVTLASPTPPCANAPPTRMIVGERGRVMAEDERPLNIRSAPGTSNRTITTMVIDDVFLVLEGPACRDNYVWYRIRHDDVEGWVAEGDFAVYYIEPYLPG